MKTQEENARTTFKSLLTGSATARNLSFLYIAISLFLAYKMRSHIEYVIPLVMGAILILWYTISHLMLTKFNLKKYDLKDQFYRYNSHILKREKYESTVFFIWLLTIVPAYLFEKELDTFTILRFMIIIYVICMLGNYLFKKTKDELGKLEIKILAIDADSTDSNLLDSKN